MVPNDFLTTVDSADVRTELEFGKNESAVIEPLPLTLETSTPVNVRVFQYDDAAVKVLLNGHGEAVLNMFVGTYYPITAYKVTFGQAPAAIEESEGLLSVPLSLDGEAEVVIEMPDQGQ